MTNMQFTRNIGRWHDNDKGFRRGIVARSEEALTVPPVIETGFDRAGSKVGGSSVVFKSSVT